MAAASRSMAVLQSFKFYSRISQRVPKLQSHAMSFASGPGKMSEEELKKFQASRMARGLPKKTPIRGVGQIIVVASGKGGVGKSTTAVNLALAMKAVEKEKSIGILDADVYGPSIPLMMNLQEEPELTKDNLMKPLSNYGLQCMSMGFLVGANSPVVWRGLMVMSALERLLYQVSWSPPLDVLVVDTPPGTGDTHLSLAQRIPITGVLLVSTPQQVAQADTRKGAVMFQKMQVPLLGMVSNMSTFVCTHCGEHSRIFKGGLQRTAKELGISVLAEIPLDPSISEASDSGKPLLVSHPSSPQSEAYKELARQVLTALDSTRQEVKVM